ncbi:hypothetical protein BCR33DRAFT_662809, partial [Rhizoclosmatium globosum]
TTMLHKDSASAYNTLLYVQDDTRPGALWHIFNQDDTRMIAKVFNQPEINSNPLMDFTLYLNAKDLEVLEREHGVKPIVIEQRVGEMILIPAGCAHQVRNLQLCVKVRTFFILMYVY